MRYSGFAPFVNGDSNILILGSFPSVKSREQGFYYGHPRNRFWKVLSSAYGDDTPQTVEERKAFLLRHSIALYDVVAECEIVGSLDSAIKDYEVADLEPIFSEAPIERVLLNGGKAAALFKKYYPQYANIAIPLPSTSPLNTRFDITPWIEALFTN